MDAEIKRLQSESKSLQKQIYKFNLIIEKLKLKTSEYEFSDFSFSVIYIKNFHTKK